jgi:hypothetical protein
MFGSNKRDVLKRQRIAVECDGELVKLHVGNSTLTMDYETGLQMSQWLRFRSKEAKRNAGDVSRHWSALGLLDDLERTRG